MIRTSLMLIRNFAERETKARYKRSAWAGCGR